MTRVLLLLLRDGDLQYRRSLSALTEGDTSFEITTRTIGRGGDYANLFWAVIGLRRLVDQFDVVHAWDERGAVAAALAGARRIVFTAPSSFSRRGLPILRRACRRGNLQIACGTAAHRARFIFEGISPERCYRIRPPVNVEDITSTSRQSMRRFLGIGDDEFVLLSPGESTRAAAHERAVWAGSILHVIDERYRVLLWGRGERIEFDAGLGEQLRQPRLVIVAERALRRPIEFEVLLPAADAMLVTAGGPVPTLGIALAMASGIPIVASESRHLAELLIDETTALTVPKPEPRALAQRMLDLRADTERRRVIAKNAARFAREQFAPARFLDQYHALYGYAPAAKTGAATERLPAVAELAPT